MKILLLGASGGCGRWFGRFAGARDHELTALVRPATAYHAPAGVRVIRGDPLDERSISDLVRGQDAVVSCLGVKRRHPLNPWSELASPPDLTARITRTRARVVSAFRTWSVVSRVGVATWLLDAVE